MTNFTVEIRRFITEYKKILRRQVSDQARKHKKDAIGIQRQQLKSATDIDLYHIAHRMLHDLNTKLRQQQANEYSGTREFAHHLQSLLNQYIVKNNQVVHIARHTSCALIEVIQYIATTHDDKPSNDLISKVHTLKTHGSSNEKKLLRNAIMQRQHHAIANNFLAELRSS